MCVYIDGNRQGMVVIKEKTEKFGEKLVKNFKKI